MILNIVFFGLMLINVPSPSTAKCSWGTNSACVTFLKLFWSNQERVNNLCCKSSGNNDITLCPEKNLDGICYSYFVPIDKCVRLKGPEQVMSVKTFGNCYRFYENEDCTGESIGVNPDIENNNDFKGFMKSGERYAVSSLSRCFQSDMCVSRSEQSVNYETGCHWPNDRLRHGSIPWLPYDIDGLKGSPVLWYQTGRWSNRTDVMHAHIYRHHVNYHLDISENAKRYVKDVGYPGDEVGLILPPRFSGSGSDLRNIYPQGRNFDVSKWNTVQDSIEDMITKYGNVYFTVNLAYHLPTDTRPYLMIYRCRPGDLSSDEIMIDDLVNPQRE